MAIEKSDISHVEQSSHHQPATFDQEAVRGRDFTVSDDELPPGYFRSFNFIGSIVAIGAAFGCGVGGFTLIAPILAIVNADLGPDPNIIWMALSYLLTTSIGMIIVGRVSDIFGRRWIFIVGNLVGLLGSIVCAVGKNIPTLIAGETLIGLGGSVQLSYSCEFRLCFLLITLMLDSRYLRTGANKMEIPRPSFRLPLGHPLQWCCTSCGLFLCVPNSRWMERVSNMI